MSSDHDRTPNLLDVPDLRLRSVRVLVTGAGRPGAISVLKSLSADPSVHLVAADVDPGAAGLSLVPPEARTLIPAGTNPQFAGVMLARCLKMGIDVLIPTVDAELRPLALARADFSWAGVELMLAPDRALNICLDNLALAQCCAGQVPVPRTERFGPAGHLKAWTYPVIVKPGTGGGSRDICLVESSQALARLGAPAGCIVQEYLPGEEYSVDVLADTAGQVVASVPKARERVDSAESVAGRTLHDGELERLGAAVATATGLTYIASVRFRYYAAGRPALLGVKPRVPGTLPLTVASGVDMPRMALDSLRGRPLPGHADFRDTAMDRYLQECFTEPGDVTQAAA